MHLQMRIALQTFNSDEHRAIRHTRPLLSPSVPPRMPDRLDDAGDFLVARGVAKRPAQILAARRIETEIPQPVSGQPAAIARSAEGRGRGRDDAEDGPVAQTKALRRGVRRLA